MRQGMRHRTRLAAASLTVAAAALLAACSNGDGAAGDAGLTVGGALSEAEIAREVAATLQACSYDGAQVSILPDVLESDPPRDCVEMVDRIMRFTGLPPNFVVGEADVPNAAAVILPDDNRVLQRVIAFNPNFMDEVQRAAGGSVWAPVSIMAHEIGHHLSGHTILEGGSRPPIELEADKFSGFVLYKMGAALRDAKRAMEVFGDPHGGPTHPARDHRLAAIREGWMQACAQQQDEDCDVAATQSTRAQVQPPPQPVPTVRTGQRDRLPQADPATLPNKVGRYVIDETGLLDPQRRAQFERTLYDHARDSGVEIVLLLVDDLQGRTAEDFAWAMMRQLRVGKLDVGNGAVLVVAPGQNQAGVAMGPGVALAMEHADPAETLQRWIDNAWAYCVEQNGCGNWIDNLFMTPDFIRRSTADLVWTIGHQSLADFRDAAQAYSKRRLEEGGEYRREDDPIYRHLVRFEAEVVDLQVEPGISGVMNPEILANAAIVNRGRQAIHVRSPEGYDAVVYLDPRTVPLMPSGMLEPGARYSLVGRVQSPAAIRAHADHLFLLSWERLQ